MQIINEKEYKINEGGEGNPNILYSQHSQRTRHMYHTKKVSMLLLVFMVMIIQVHAASIGISPGAIRFGEILPGGYAERVVTVTSNSEQPIFGHIDIKGDLASWIEIEPNVTRFNASASNPFELKVIMRPPADSRIDEYSGEIDFVTEGVGKI